MPARLRPTAPIAADAILVGDPGRALMLAQALLEQPKMSNHARGLWGYSGRTPEGRELTIQSTGMGGPSAALVLGDLHELGVRRAVRIGTCAGLETGWQPGQLVVAEEATGSGGGPVRPDPELTAAIADRLTEARNVSVASLDTLFRPGKDEPPEEGKVADMQTAALFDRGAELGLRLAAILIVAETPDTGLLDEELEAAAKVAGEAATAALST
jgi:purine-nucleoside phosphorylase